MGRKGVHVQTRTDRALENSLSGASKMVVLICSTMKGQAYADAAVAKLTNTGNGTVTGVAVGEAAAKTETFTLECAVVGGANVGKFNVTGSVSGLQAAQATVGVAYTTSGGELTFTVNAGGVGFIVGDLFTVDTHATLINKPTSTSSVAEFDALYGQITSGVGMLLAWIQTKSGDLARAMVITAIKNGAPGGLFVVSAKAHGVTRGAVSNAEYLAAVNACANLGTKVMAHESINQTDQINLAQFCFDQGVAAGVIKHSWAFFGLGVAKTYADHTTRSAALDNGVSRGFDLEAPTPYSLVSPAPLDENGNAFDATAVAHGVGYACARAGEDDPAMPLHTLEISGFGGLEREWTDGTSSDHDLLNDNGVCTSQSRGRRVMIHAVVSCIQNSPAQSKQYAAWHDETGIWIDYHLRAAAINKFSAPPYNRTKNSPEVRGSMVGDWNAEMLKFEKVEWPTSRGKGIIENVAAHLAETTCVAELTNPKAARLTYVYDRVSPLDTITITAYVIV